MHFTSYNDDRIYACLPIYYLLFFVSETMWKVDFLSILRHALSHSTASNFHMFELILLKKYQHPVIQFVTHLNGILQ